MDAYAEAVERGNKVTTERKIHAMHRRFGTCAGLFCRDCDHLISGDYHNRKYHKCELYGLSHSEATDWRLSYTACGMYNMEVNLDVATPLFEEIKYQRKSPEPPLEGQVRLEVGP